MKITRKKVTESYQLNTKSDHYKMLTGELKRQGYEPKISKSTSVTEAAVLSVKGVPTYILACGVYNTHTTNEYVKVAEMVKAKNFLVNLIRKI